VGLFWRAYDHAAISPLHVNDSRAISEINGAGDLLALRPQRPVPESDVECATSRDNASFDLTPRDQSDNLIHELLGLSEKENRNRARHHMDAFTNSPRPNWKSALDRLITSIVREAWSEYQSSGRFREAWAAERSPWLWQHFQNRIPAGSYEQLDKKAHTEQEAIDQGAFTSFICLELGLLICLVLPSLRAWRSPWQRVPPREDSIDSGAASEEVLDALASAFGSIPDLYPGSPAGPTDAKAYLRDLIEQQDIEDFGIETVWCKFGALITASSLGEEYLRPLLSIFAICIAALDEHAQEECLEALEKLASPLAEHAGVSPIFLSGLAANLSVELSDLDFDGRDPVDALSKFFLAFTFHPSSDISLALPADDSVAGIISELTEMVGLNAVKKEVISLANFIKVQRLREAKGLKQLPISLHLVFSGSPGTGKTTVARIVARLYKALGVLTKGHLVEVDRGGLVSQYVGATAIKTKEAVESALDGVLFIDEAYSLYKETSWGDVGSEAVETLLKLMEDYRDRLVVIAAGYTDKMAEFIASNPGLQSRFTRKIEFQNYTAQEMLKIFEQNAVSNNFDLHPDARSILLDRFRLVEGDDGFGNGRGVRNIFEASIIAHANRIAAIKSPSDRDLSLLLSVDVVDAIAA
jgi:stage V sporulation protein K